MRAAQRKDFSLRTFFLTFRAGIIKVIFVPHYIFSTRNSFYTFLMYPHIDLKERKL